MSLYSETSCFVAEHSQARHAVTDLISKSSQPETNGSLTNVHHGRTLNVK